MEFSLKVPIGGLFTIYGVILCIEGAFGDPQAYSKSLGLNMNAAWGAIMLLFGVAMLVSAVRRPK